MGTKSAACAVVPKRATAPKAASVYDGIPKHGHEVRITSPPYATLNGKRQRLALGKTYHVLEVGRRFPNRSASFSDAGVSSGTHGFFTVRMALDYSKSIRIV